MIQNHCLFPIYDHIGQQFRFRSNCENREVEAFLTPNYMLPAFFFTRSKSPWQIDTFEVKNLSGTTVATIPVSHLQTVSSADWDGIGYANKVIRREEDEVADGFENYLLPCGLYYIELTETQYPNYGKKYYSEVFKVVDADAVTDGEEIVPNGKFIGGLMTGWTTSGTWDASSGKAEYSGGGGGYILDRTISYTSDGAHLYKISFNITNYNDGGNTSRYLRVYSNGLNTSDNVKVNDNGAYVFYVNDVSRVLIQHFGGTVTFDIDNISIQKVIGLDGYVTIMATKDCKFPNNISNSHNYFNLLPLDAKILEPVYGEDSLENENGRFENLITFVRSFKTHTITPLLLPEPVVDAIAQLNTFDISEIHNSETNEHWQLSDSDDAESALKPRSFIRFNISTEWQDGQCYALMNINFEENLSLKNGCCDTDVTVDCFSEETTIEYTVVGSNTGIQISLSNNPTGLTAAYVLPIILRGEDCESAFEQVAYPLDEAITWQEFAENGIFFTEAGFTDYVYSVQLLVLQFGCESQITTDAVCSNAYELELVSVVDACDGADSELTVTTNITNYTLVVIEFWDNDNSQWIEPTLVVDGANTPFTISFASELAITKARLRAPNGDLSDELAITLSVCE